MVAASRTADGSVTELHVRTEQVAFSPDTTTFAPESWVLSASPAYGNHIQLQNGSILTAQRR